ncbi:hypothetical protein NLI96_g6717 [Meripilus lineatus]|uniref:Uncharacterized protein n=1 Tax=Meripilus lineatus TaxID=2056292 RepID=A0AAD5YHU5_9APHY|nr:hypothetical protein NLI96_g6717 [Physisporinus lineatus]
MLFTLYPFLIFLLISVPATVSACEDDCMDGVTNAFLQKYNQGPLENAITKIAQEVSGLIPSHPSLATSRNLIQPILDAYQNVAFENLRTSIFPDFFHGKCQQNGIIPPGCPNPDCPVVCGTPGSLVHFYPKLRYIVYNSTRHSLSMFTNPRSKPYQQALQAVEDAANSANGPERRSLRFFPRSLLDPYDQPETKVKSEHPDIPSQFLAIISGMLSRLLEACGGSAEGSTNGLPLCSWEQQLKEYILSYP